MGDTTTFPDEIHRQLAVDLFNQTWSLIDKDDRSRSDQRTMINCAHASLYHWRQVGTELNLQRGEWLISRVYVLVGAAAAALDHAEECLRLTEEHGIGGFDRAFAHESVARAAACSGDRSLFREQFAAAESAGKAIAEEDDRDYFTKDLYGGPWFGMR